MILHPTLTADRIARTPPRAGQGRLLWCLRDHTRDSSSPFPPHSLDLHRRHDSCAHKGRGCAGETHAVIYALPHPSPMALRAVCRDPNFVAWLCGPLVKASAPLHPCDYAAHLDSFGLASSLICLISVANRSMNMAALSGLLDMSLRRGIQ